MNLIRSEKRMMCADIVKVQWHTEEGHFCVDALIEDISAHGACLQLDCEVPAGLALTVEHGNLQLSGTVKYCVFREIGFFAGICFDEQSRSAAVVLKPKHLLDLCRLGMA